MNPTPDPNEWYRQEERELERTRKLMSRRRRVVNPLYAIAIVIAVMIAVMFILFARDSTLLRR